jgi:NADH-quinone oxidoreductase subunit E
MISNKAKKQIDTWVAKYPTGRQSSAVMEALKIVQAENFFVWRYRTEHFFD